MRIWILWLISMINFSSAAQQGWWHGMLRRDDGKDIVFEFEWKKEKTGDVWYIRNGSESIRVSNITHAKDSIFAQMPIFESQFRVLYAHQHLQGFWIKGTTDKPQAMRFEAVPGKDRFRDVGKPVANISGRWSAKISNENKINSSVAEFRQTGNRLTGTFMNPTGDYRFMEGLVTKDSMYLSSFDGVHAFLLTAHVDNDHTISGGSYFGGLGKQRFWEAVKDPKARISFDASAIYLKPGEDSLNFTFNDLDNKPVSINDKQFKDKVVVIQLMGSWCPNCMDETAYLSDYYNRNKDKGIAFIALAYEYSTDRERSVRSLRKFQTQFNIEYPMLITGVAINDSLKTEKTLPQITRIKSFPATIIIDKKGKVRKLDTAFNGPATGVHYEEYKKDFESTIDQLLKE